MKTLALLITLAMTSCATIDEQWQTVEQQLDTGEIRVVVGKRTVLGLEFGPIGLGLWYVTTDAQAMSLGEPDASK